MINKAELLENTGSYGTKYAIQKLFNEIGMCSEKTKLLKNSATQDEVIKALSEFDVEKTGVTIRFSHNKSLNLPRQFFSDKHACLDFINKNRNVYSIILQEYRMLRTSFELYFNNSAGYLQIMPGRWEVSNNNKPDIIKFDNGGITIWRYPKKRKAKLSTKYGDLYEEKIEPYTFERLNSYYEKLTNYREQIIELNSIYHPLYCHFYEDQNGKISFLNIRDFGLFHLNYNSPQEFYQISNDSDINNWRGKKPILFNITATRENDRPLVRSINLLVKRGIRKVFVNYGILSHPAILLREAGIEVEQSYSDYEVLNIPNSKTISVYSNPTPGIYWGKT